jgi:hypothetical protein
LVVPELYRNNLVAPEANNWVKVFFLAAKMLDNIKGKRVLDN